MSSTPFLDLSPCEIEQMLKRNNLSKRQTKRYRDRLCRLRKRAEKRIERWSKSPVIKESCRILRKQKKCKPVYKEGILIGYEYDLLEAIWVRIRKVQQDEKMCGNENNKDGFKAAVIAKKNRKIHQMAGR